MDARTGRRHFQGTKESFVGRFQEQKLFRGYFRHLTASHDTQANKLSSVDFPKVVFVSGEGGLGKSTLLRQFIAIASEEDYNMTSLVIRVDWEQYSLDPADSGEST